MQSECPSRHRMNALEEEAYDDYGWDESDWGWSAWQWEMVLPECVVGVVW